MDKAVCHRRYPDDSSRWCDSGGRGGFMGHTCERRKQGRRENDRRCDGLLKMQSMTDIEWACKWVGWERISLHGEGCWKVPLGGGKCTLIHDESPWIVVFLAEAVRVKFIEDRCSQIDRSQRQWPELEYAASAWVESGPPAFIKAVREVVDDGQ